MKRDREIIGYPGRIPSLDEWQSALGKALSDAIRKHKRCPECDLPHDAWDTVAIHLIDAHGWDSERARLFLRDHVEEDSFDDPA